MLKAEPDIQYIVYPSWAEGLFTFRWGDLARLFADPLGSGYLDENDWNYVRSGIIPTTVPHFQLVDGPCGGGIIATERFKGVNWLPDCILDKESEYHAPPGLGPWVERTHKKLDVAVLELRGDAGLRFAAQGMKRPRQYICGASIENADAAGDSVYWFVDYKTGKREIAGLDKISHWADGWGLRAERLEAMPSELRAETASWFSEMDRSFCWFQIHGGGSGAALEFAKMVYLGLHLRQVAGVRMNSIHLVADIEWRPNFRKDLKYK